MTTIRVAVFFALAMAGLPAFAQALPDNDAVRAGGNALERYDSFPWYDAGQDRIRRIDVEPPRDLENRHSRWQRKPLNWNWPSMPWLAQLAETIVWILTAILVGALVYAMVRAFLQHELMAPGGAATVGRLGPANADRVDSLPFQLARPKVDLLAEAQRLYEEGQFGEAIVYLYSYQLVQLDQHQVIRLTRGKTNRQYLGEVRRQSPLRSMLETTMRAFEDVFFGNHSLDRARFEMCWNRLDEFHREIE